MPLSRSCSFLTSFLCLAGLGLFSPTPSAAQSTQPATTQPAQGEQAENPLYQHWTQFEPGAYARYATQAQVAGLLYETESEVKLVQKTPEAVVLEITSTTRGPDGESQPQTQQVRIPAVQASAASTRPTTAPGQRTYTDTITTPAGEFEAEVTEATAERAEGPVTSKTYISQEIPGRLIFSEVTGQGLSENKATTRLIDYGTGGAEPNNP